MLPAPAATRAAHPAGALVCVAPPVSVRVALLVRVALRVLAAAVLEERIKQMELKLIHRLVKH